MEAHMNKRIITVTLLLVATSLIFAAQLVITIPASDVPRVTEAFGSVLGLTDANGSPRPATQQEVTQAVHQWIVNTTKDYERRRATYTYSPPPMEMSGSPMPSPTAGGLKK